MYYSFENVTNADNGNTISFCDATSSGVVAFYFVDRDGSFNNSSQSVLSSLSTIIGPHASMRAFLDQETVCTAVSTGCYLYCHDICFRSYRYTLSPDGSEAWSLRVCQSSNTSTCTLFPGSQRGSNDPRSFIAHLPVNQDYVAMFVDETGSLQANPPVLEEAEEENMCDGASFSISIVDGIATTQPVQKWTSFPSMVPSLIQPSFSPSISPSKTVAQVSSFLLVDATNNEAVRQLVDGDSILLETFPAWSIEAITSPERVGYVEFFLGESRVHREGAPPYALGGDSPPGDFIPVAWQPGEYTLTAIPFDATGVSGTSLSVSFSLIVSDPPTTAPHRSITAPAVRALILVDARKNVDITLIENDAEYSLSSLTQELSIRAVTNPYVVGSVQFFVDGSLTQTENVAPYLLGGNQEQDYFDAELVPGSVTVTAIAYSQSKGLGEEYNSLTKTFTIVA